MWSFFRSHKKSRSSHKSAALQRSVFQKPGIRHLALEPLEGRELLTALYWAGGTGTWNTSSVSWSTTPGGSATQAWQAGCDAYFSRATDVVTLGAAVNASSIQLSAGTLKMSAAGSLNSSATMTANGGVFDLNGKNVTLKGLNSTSVTSTAVVANNLASTNATLTLDGDNTFSEYFGALKDYSGSSGGTLALTVTNTAANPTGGNNFFLYKSGSNYTGTTNLLPGNSGAALINAATNALSPNSSINVGANCNLDLDNCNAVIDGLSGTGIVYNWFSGTTTATLTINNAAYRNFSGSIRDYSTSKVSIVKSNSGIQTFSGNNTYSGSSTVAFGTLLAGSSTAFSANTVLIVNGGLVDLNGNNETVKGLNSNYPSGGVVANNLAATNATLTLDGDNRFDSYYGYLVDHTASPGGILGLTVTNTAASPTGGNNFFLYVSGSNYSGATNILRGNGGAALINNATNALSPNSSVNVGTGCNLDLNNYSAKIAGLEGSGIVYNWFSGTNTSTLTVNNTTDKTFSGSIRDYVSTSKVALVVNGGGTLILTGNNTNTGGTTISYGTLQLGDGTNNGSITGNIVNNDNLQFNNSTAQTYSGSISGTGEVYIYGKATMTFSGNSAYTGETHLLGDFNLTGTLNTYDVIGYDGTHPNYLHGSGIINGAVNLGTNSHLSPGINLSPAHLSIGTLQFFSASTFSPFIGSGYDQVQVTGTVNFGGTLFATSTRSVSDGSVLTLIKNDGTDAIVGTLAYLPEWSTVTLNGLNYHITYCYNAEAETFGNGNDLALVDY